MIHITMPIDTAALPFFLSAVAALLLVPGPDFFLISSQAASRGTKYGAACALGVAVAGFIQTALVAAGLGQMMETWPVIATFVRLAGAAYLAYLGVSLLRSWWRDRHTGPIDPAAAASQVVNRPVRHIFLAGVANNLLNPKALLFFSVFIPQFVNPALGSPSTQLAVLGILLTTIAVAYNLLVALIFGQFRRLRFGGGSLKRHGDGIVGALFVLLASRLAFSKTA